MNKNKEKPVSSWAMPTSGGSMKALQRVVWILIFLVYGVHTAKAEEQEIQVQKRSEKDPHPIPRVDNSHKRIHSCENCE